LIKYTAVLLLKCAMSAAAYPAAVLNAVIFVQCHAAQRV
jgi:hypothetical protein